MTQIIYFLKTTPLILVLPNCYGISVGLGHVLPVFSASSQVASFLMLPVCLGVLLAISPSDYSVVVHGVWKSDCGC
jgi:hypothetical protein